MNKYLIILLWLLCVVVTSCIKSDAKNLYGSIYGLESVFETGMPMRATGVKLYKQISGALSLKTVTYDDGHFEFDDLLLEGMY